MACEILQQSIFTADRTLSKELQVALITNLWTCNQNLGNSVNAFHAYFAYYKDQCLATRGDEHVASTHQDIVNIVSHITQHFMETKDALRTSLHRDYPQFRNDQGLTNSIELAARLWLMINFKSSPSITFISLQTPIAWPETESLSNVFHNQFTISQPQYCTTKTHFPKLLNGQDLERIGGIHVNLTDNLLDHLAINDNAVSLFCHVSVLRHIKGSLSGDPILYAFIDETLQTIALLLPRSHTDCRLWFEKRVKQSSLDQEILDLDAAPREVKRYVYWHDRLLILQEVFDAAEPSSLSQWWFDRRKKVQWYTFWVAIIVLLLTVVFGLIQSITGIVQAWASVKSLH